MAKKVSKKDLRELIGFCIKKTFPKEEYGDDLFPNLKELEKEIIIDSIYISVKNLGLFRKKDIRRLNKNFRIYAGNNLICTGWSEIGEMIIRNEYQVID